MFSPSKTPDLSFAQTTACDDAEAGLRLAQACTVVESFVSGTNLPAIEDLLEATGHTRPAEAARRARSVSDRLRLRSAGLDREVALFLDIASRR